MYIYIDEFHSKIIYVGLAQARPNYKFVMSGFLSTWVDLLSIGWAYFEWRGPIFEREVLENTPTPLFEQPLKFIAHGRVSSDYGTLTHHG